MALGVFTTRVGGDRKDHDGTVIDEFIDMKMLACLHDGSSTGRGPEMQSKSLLSVSTLLSHSRADIAVWDVNSDTTDHYSVY